MKLGSLEFMPVEDDWDLVGVPVKESIEKNGLTGVEAVAIDPTLSDTAAFCEQYGVGLDISVNCVIVEAKRGDRTWFAALLVPATIRADINGIVRRELDAKKVSFAPMEKAVTESGMPSGGISPIGLPAGWPLLVDAGAAAMSHAVIGAGIRDSKLVVPGSLLASLPNAKVLSLEKPAI